MVAELANKFYGMAVSFYNKAVSVCTLEANGPDDIEINDEHSWIIRSKDQKLDVEVLKSVLTTVYLVARLEEAENERNNTRDYHFPVVVACPQDTHFPQTLLDDEELNEMRQQYLKDYDDDGAVSKKIVKDLIEAALDRATEKTAVDLRDGAFKLESRSRGSVNRFNPRSKKRRIKEKYLKRIKKLHHEAMLGSKKATRHLCKIARRYARDAMDRALREPRSVFSRDSINFFPLDANEDRYLNLPQVEAAIKDEFRKNGFNNGLAVSFPDSEKQPYFSSLLRIFMSQNIAKSLLEA